MRKMLLYFAMLISALASFSNGLSEEYSYGSYNSSNITIETPNPQETYDKGAKILEAHKAAFISYNMKEESNSKKKRIDSQFIIDRDTISLRGQA